MTRLFTVLATLWHELRAFFTKLFVGSTSFAGEVPTAPRYCDSVAQMDAKQLRFYRHLERKLKRGEYVDVQGEIGYIFPFIYGYILRWNESGFESLHEFLTHIAELYVRENKISDYCRYLAWDCLLGLGKYELFLERTVPKSVTTGGTHHANLRINLQRHHTSRRLTQLLEVVAIDLRDLQRAMRDPDAPV